MTPDLSIVIPAWNEEKRIGKTLTAIKTYLGTQESSYEIIIADDGSTDQTKAVIESLGDSSIQILSGSHRGKGDAIRRGAMGAKGKWILVTDADLSTPIEELDRFLVAGKSGASVVIGSRGIPGAQILVRQSRYRQWGGTGLNVAVRAIALPGIYDTQCGFKLFSREAIQSICPRQTIPGFGSDVELLFLARKFGFTILELPIIWRNDPATHVSPIKDGLRILVDLAKIRFNDAVGRYK